MLNPWRLNRPYQGAFQSTFVGRAIRIISQNKLLKYPDEIDFPKAYTRESIARKVEQQQRIQLNRSHGSGNNHPTIEGDRENDNHDASQPFVSSATLTNPTDPSRSGERLNGTRDGNGEKGRSDGAMDGTWEPKTAEEKKAMPENGEKKRQESPPSGVDAEKGEDPNLVTWYSKEDKENPSVSSLHELGEAELSCINLSSHPRSHLCNIGNSISMESTYNSTFAIVDLPETSPCASTVTTGQPATNPSLLFKCQSSHSPSTSVLPSILPEYPVQTQIQSQCSSTSQLPLDWLVSLFSWRGMGLGRCYGHHCPSSQISDGYQSVRSSVHMPVSNSQLIEDFNRYCNYSCICCSAIPNHICECEYCFLRSYITSID